METRGGTARREAVAPPPTALAPPGRLAAPQRRVHASFVSSAIKRLAPPPKTQVAFDGRPPGGATAAVNGPSGRRLKGEVVAAAAVAGRRGPLLLW